MERKEFNLNPFVNLDPVEYYGLLEIVNINYQNLLRGFLEGKLGNLDEVCLILTGSDGKRERHCQSRTEIIIIGNNQSLVLGTREEIGKIFGENGVPLESNPSDCLPEGRTLDENLSYAYNNRELVYPDRVLHSQFLIGSKEIYQQAILKVLDEIITDGRIYDHVRRQLNDYKKAFREGDYRGQTIFSWGDGIQWYEENKDPKLSRLGFKMGPLRAVQRKLDVITFKALRHDDQLKGKIRERYVEGGLSNTLVRIEFLSQIGLIPEDLKNKLIEAYYWFLQQYHQAQENYKQTRRPVELAFDIDLGDYHRGIIEKFLEIK